MLALARGPREWRSLWEDWRRLHVDAPARLYGKAEAEAVLLRHFPLAGRSVVVVGVGGGVWAEGERDSD